METKLGRLFILLTDKCNLDCEFCLYRDRRHEGCPDPGFDAAPAVNHIDTAKGHAQASLCALMQEVDTVGLSGGGEPLLNLPCLLSIVRSAEHKRFVLTTSGAFPEAVLLDAIGSIDSACKTKSNKCVLRLSVDRFHSGKCSDDGLQTFLRWFVEGKWQNCAYLFLRSNVGEQDFVERTLRQVCERNAWPFELGEKNAFASVAKVAGKILPIVFRPVVNPGKYSTKSGLSTLAYLNMLEQIDGREVKLGVPKGCQGCQGCQGSGPTACQATDGLDVTVDTDGCVYVYGAELSSLGSIYDEVLSGRALGARLARDPVYDVLLNRPLKSILSKLSDHPEFRQCIEATNYPFWVMRNLKKTDEPRLRSMLLAMR